MSPYSTFHNKPGSPATKPSLCQTEIPAITLLRTCSVIAPASFLPMTLPSNPFEKLLVALAAAPSLFWYLVVENDCDDPGNYLNDEQKNALGQEEMTRLRGNYRNLSCLTLRNQTGLDKEQYHAVLKHYGLISVGSGTMSV